MGEGEEEGDSISLSKGEFQLEFMQYPNAKFFFLIGYSLLFSRFRESSFGTLHIRTFWIL